MNLNISKSGTGTAINHLLVDIGDFSRMIGFTFKIIDFLGKVVYETIINQQVIDLNLNAIGGRGTYFVQVVDDSSQILEIEKIVLR